MAAGKWISGVVGFMAAGPLGALAGYALGYLFEKVIDNGNSTESDYRDSYYQKSSYNNQQGYQKQADEGQRNSFMFSLLVLSSYIIKADGKVMHSEMDFVRRFLRENFGTEAQLQGEDILLKLFKKQDEIGPYQFQSVIHDSCIQIAQNMELEQRLQLLNYLAMIAKADGIIAPEEIKTLKEVAINLGLSANNVESMLNLKEAGNNLEAAYKVLEVSPDATDEEVKKAYRRLALQNHPDRVATLGEDIKKAAEKKFQEINAAKELIWKQRGL